MAAGRGASSAPPLLSIEGTDDETVSAGLGGSALSSAVMQADGGVASSNPQTPAGSALAPVAAGRVHAGGCSVDAVSGGRGTSAVALDSRFPKSGVVAGTGGVSAGARLESLGSGTTCFVAPPAESPRSSLTNGWTLVPLTRFLSRHCR